MCHRITIRLLRLFLRANHQLHLLKLLQHQNQRLLQQAHHPQRHPNQALYLNPQQRAQNQQLQQQVKRLSDREVRLFLLRREDRGDTKKSCTFSLSQFPKNFYLPVYN